MLVALFSLFLHKLILLHVIVISVLLLSSSCCTVFTLDAGRFIVVGSKKVKEDMVIKVFE